MEKTPTHPSIVASHLPTQLFDELSSIIKGKVYHRDDARFLERSRMFNGNVLNASKAVACPLDAQDVSQILRFCTKHALSPSIKAGGFGTAGWAINGDIVVDLSLIHDTHIEAPRPDGSYTSLRAPARTTAPPATHDAAGVKRPREDAAERPHGGIPASVRAYDAASASIAGFLHGAALPADDSGEAPRQPPANRRRLDAPALDAEGRTASNDSASSAASGSTAQTTPPASKAGSVPPAPAPDPFGYMASASASAPALPPSFGQGLTASLWAPHTASAPARAPVPGQRLEPLHAHAYVTFGAGVTQKEVDVFTAGAPLRAVGADGAVGSVPYHVPFAAHPVGSSVMLLGGFGFLSRLRGLSIDNLVEVEMVLADGRIVVVNEKDHPDLWWGLRGAGPALGVATRYVARAYPVPVVFAGNLIYRFHRATAPSLIKHFRDCVKGAPRELYANVLLTAGPADKDSLVVVQMCYVGPREAGRTHLAALASWTGERCLLNEVHEKSFLAQQDSVAQVLRGKAGRQWFIRSALITSLPDEVINKTVLEFADTPIGCTWLFELAGGAIGDFEDTCVPKTQRTAAFTIAALHQWDMGIDDPRCVETAEEWLKDTIRPVAAGGPFPSFLGRGEPPARTIACFGASWERLCVLKKRYDPAGLFRNTFWPLDGEGVELDPRAHEPATPAGANLI